MKNIVLMCLMLMAFATVSVAGPIQVENVNVPNTFDYMGPVVHKLTLDNGKTVAYVDEGEKDWTPVVYVGGAGTAARAMSLTEFARSLRKELQLRIITVGRNGFGETDYVADWGYEDYAKEVKAVLDHLGVNEFAGLAISGGGPYLAAIAALMPENVISLHFASAVTQFPADRWNCKASKKEIAEKLRNLITRPTIWWDLGKNTSVTKIPGFQDTANEDGARSFFMRGQAYNEAKDSSFHLETAVSEEYARFCTPLVDISQIKAPVYTYYGLADTTVPPEHADYWKSKLNVVKDRRYPGEGHDVQYRHWEQIMLDMAGLGDHLIVTHKNKSVILPETEAKALLTKGDATLGIRAWQTGERN